MEKRKRQLTQLRSEIEELDGRFTMIFQELQWDRKHLLENKPKVTCEYDANHRVLQDSKAKHEVQCRLVHNGYSKEDKTLPEPFDMSSKTLIRFDNDMIRHLIERAASKDPSFKKVFNNISDAAENILFILEYVGIEPQTLDRLQAAYTADERRAIYDAAVQAAPFCHDLSDLALPNEQGQEESSKKQKSRMEILAELRDMKRRRTKYRVAAKTRNYSDVLRDVIKTQMEVYSEVKVEKKESLSTNAKWNDQEKLNSIKPHRPSTSRNYSVPMSEHHEKYKKRSRHDEDESSSTKKARYEELDDKSWYTDHKNRFGDDKRRKDRHSSRDSHKHDDKYNEERIKQRTKEHSNHNRYEDKSHRESKSYESEGHRERKRYEEISHKKSKQYEDKGYNERKEYSRGDADKCRREKHSSSRGQRDEGFESIRYYSSYKYERKRDKKNYSEHRK